MILSVNLNPCIDKTVFFSSSNLGDVDREGGVTASEISMIAGGKGNNVARVLKRCDYDVHVLNLVGGIQGETVLRLLDREGLAYTPLHVNGKTREIITIVDTQTYKQTVYFGPSPAITNEERQELMSKYNALISESELVILAGSLPDPNHSDIYNRMITTAKTSGLKTILDTRDKALELGIEAGPFSVKPNMVEAEKLFKGELDEEHKAQDVLNKLAAKGVSLAMVSLGEEGALLRYKNKTYHAQPPEVEVINPVGSGDSFVACLAMGLMDGADVDTIARLSVAAGAANASVWDPAGITMHQVQELMPLVKIKCL